MLDPLIVNDFLAEVWSGRERHRVGAHEIDVVSRTGLAKMKRAAGRPQDLADIDHLGLDEDPS